MKKTSLLKIFSWLITGLVLWFFVKNLASNWQAISQYRYQINISLLLFSSLVFIFGIFLITQIWYAFLRRFGYKVSRKKVFNAVFLSLFGRYIPGKVWMYLIRLRFLQKEKIPLKVFTAISFFEIGLSTIAGLLLSLILAWRYLAETPYFLPSLILIPLGVASLHPRVFYSVFNFGLKKIGRNEIPKSMQLEFSELLKFLLFYLIYWLVLGTAFYIFLNSLIIVSPNKIPALIGVFALSYNLGALAIFVPSGLGIREGIQVYFLNYFLPTGVSILISLLARIWATINELILLGALWLASLISQRPLFENTDVGIQEVFREDKREVDEEVNVQNYVSEYFESRRYAESYSLAYHNWRAQKMFSLIDLREPILDLGCGTGFLAQFLKGYNVVGLDISPKMVEYAKKRYSKVVLGDASNLPFKDSSFQVVICGALLHHLPDPSRGVSEIHRVLKDGGQALFVETHYAVLNAIPRLLVKKGKHFSLLHKNFKENELRKIIGSKFEIEKVYYTGYIAYFLLGFPDVFNIYKFFPFKMALTPFLIKLDELLGRIPLFRHLSWNIMVVARKRE